MVVVGQSAADRRRMACWTLTSPLSSFFGYERAELTPLDYSSPAQLPMTRPSS